MLLDAVMVVFADVARKTTPPSAVPVIVPSEPVSDTATDVLSCVMELDDNADRESSTYFLLATSPSALGADVVRPVIVFAEAEIVMSPTDNPFFTLKFLVVMVPISPS
jgi:predicted component of type VI protein secretion system